MSVCGISHAQTFGRSDCEGLRPRMDVVKPQITAWQGKDHILTLECQGIFQSEDFAISQTPQKPKPSWVHYLNLVYAQVVVWVTIWMIAQLTWGLTLTYIHYSRKRIVCQH